MPRTSTPGTYRLEVLYNSYLLYEKKFEILFYDLSQITVPNRPAFGNFSFGRGGVERSKCVTENAIAVFDINEFSKDPWIYYISTYSSKEIGNKYIFQVFNPENIMLHNTEVVLKDNDYYFCEWGGFSLKSSTPVKGKYIFKVLYNGKVLYQKDFTIK